MRRERALRKQWESMHEDVHELERQARDKAEAAINNRLEGMNELRHQIDRERANYATREYADAVFSSIDTRLKALENSKSYVIGWVAAAAASLTFIIYILKR